MHAVQLLKRRREKQEPKQRFYYAGGRTDGEEERSRARAIQLSAHRAWCLRGNEQKTIGAA